MYEVINEKLGIKACGVNDLTIEQVNNFLGLWEDGARIGTLTMFFERENGDLVLNKDNEMFNTYRELAEKYMEASSEVRKEIWENCPVPGARETLRVMENCLKYRRIENELFRTRKNVITSKTSWMVLNEIKKRFDLSSAISVAFRYGIMQGKRMEREKKKRQSVTD